MAKVLSMIFLKLLVVPSGPVIWAGKTRYSGTDLGQGSANASKVGNNTLNGKEAAAFVQLVGDGHTRTVVMTGHYENHEIPYMFYQQLQRKRLEFDWLLISSDAVKNEFLQFGSFNMEFHSAEKCHYVTFDQV